MGQDCCAQRKYKEPDPEIPRVTRISRVLELPSAYPSCIVEEPRNVRRRSMTIEQIPREQLECLSFSTNFNSNSAESSSIEYRLQNRLKPGRINVDFLRQLELRIRGVEMVSELKEPEVQLLDRPMQLGKHKRRQQTLLI